MYRIRTVCQNPACQDVFEVKFTETGPIEAETTEEAFKLCNDLRHRPFSYKGAYSGGNSPKFIKCPKCDSLFPIGRFRFFMYDAGQDPDRVSDPGPIIE